MTQLKTSFLDSPSLPSPGGFSAPATQCYLRGPEVCSVLRLPLEPQPSWVSIHGPRGPSLDQDSSVIWEVLLEAPLPPNSGRYCHFHTYR